MRLIELLSITKAQNYILMQTHIDFQSKYQIYYQIISFKAHHHNQATLHSFQIFTDIKERNQKKV